MAKGKETDKKGLVVILGSPSEKKNVMRYDYVDDAPAEAAMISCYVNKRQLKEILGDPARIKVTIEAA